MDEGGSKDRNCRCNIIGCDLVLMDMHVVIVKRHRLRAFRHIRIVTSISMSSSARLIFVLLLVVNCIIWSQSRYAQMDGSQSLGVMGRPNLAKRYLVKLGYVKDDFGLFSDDGKEVSRLSAFHCTTKSTKHISVDRLPSPSKTNVLMYRRLVQHPKRLCQCTISENITAPSLFYDLLFLLALLYGSSSCSPHLESARQTSLHLT